VRGGGRPETATYIYLSSGVTVLRVESEETVVHPLCNATEFVHPAVRTETEAKLQRAVEHRK
jgi:hypothetical protein